MKKHKLDQLLNNQPLCEILLFSRHKTQAQSKSGPSKEKGEPVKVKTSGRNRKPKRYKKGTATAMIFLFEKEGRCILHGPL